MTTPQDTGNRPLALLLSVPSVFAAVLFGVGKILESLGNRDFGNSGFVGVSVLLSFALIPVATVILVAWAVARWANHGSVPGWLLAAAIGNGFVFAVLYQMTSM